MGIVRIPIQWSTGMVLPIRNKGLNRLAVIWDPRLSNKSVNPIHSAHAIGTLFDLYCTPNNYYYLEVNTQSTLLKMEI